jgi:DNA helicase-2/ATP-dependent DNA helicase PcrA
MPKSYRCPAPVLALGEECLRAMRRGYFDRGVAPADHEGTVTRHGDFEDLTNLIAEDQEWLFLARTNYQASRLWGYLNSINVPAKSTKAPQEINAKQVGLAALYSLEKNETITGDQWAKAVPLICSQTSDKTQMFARGTKKRWKSDEEIKRWDCIWQDDLPQLGATPQLIEKIKAGEWCTLVDGGIVWRKIAERCGAERAINPLVRVGTIHSAKGLEADNVAVLTTTSMRIRNGSEDDDRHDEECRLAYVAATRARKNLHIINEAGTGKPRMEELA